MQWYFPDEFRVLTSSSTTKHKVWELYQESVTEFNEICRLLHLYRVVEATLAMRHCYEALTDICRLCQQNGAALVKCSNRSI